MKKILVLCFLLLTPLALAENLTGIIVGRYANLRSAPNVINSTILTKAFRGTTLKILDKQTEKVTIGEIEGYWYQVELIESAEKGWLLDKYIALEGDPQIQDYIKSITASLYYYRSNLDDQLKEIKKNLTRKNALEQLKNYSPRFLNYMGYHLLAEKNVLSIPVLITFMNPEFSKENSQDANYNFTWELLERLTPNTLITSNYQSFLYWWQKYHESIEISLPWYDLATIFKKIQDNENRVYRKNF